MISPPLHTSRNFVADAFFEKRRKQSVLQTKALKNAVWIYFFLLIFEGALRKWVLPGLATPLLVVRDPFAIWLLYQAIQKKLIQSNVYVISMTIIGVIGIVTSLLFGHGNIAVALYGARILMIHFPLMFVIGKVFTKDDVVKMGRVTLWIAIPMAVLIGVQFYSPQSAFVNKGVGGDETGAGFSGALGYFRPPGTFSFTNGNTAFFSFVASFVFFFWLSNEKLNKIVLIAATCALLAAIPLSISRSLTFSVGITIIFALLAASRQPKYAVKIFQAFIGLSVVIVILSQTEFVQSALEVLIVRFTVANTNEGGLQGVLLDRYLGGLVGALTHTAQMPYFGYGLGMGTNVGAILLTGKQRFLLSEGEWGRLIGEMGPLLGMIVIFIRITFSANLVFSSYKELLRNNILPWMLLSFGLFIIPQGQWAQATSLGFCTLIGGLILAAMNHSNN